MKDLSIHLLGEVTKALGHEASRLVRVRAVAMGLRALQGLRKIFLLHYIILCACFLGSLSLFFALYLTSVQLSESGSLTLTYPLSFCSLLCVISFGLLTYSVREKTWIQAFRIEELVNATLSAPRSQGSSSEHLDPEAIALIVEQVLAKKFKNN